VLDGTRPSSPAAVFRIYVVMARTGEASARHFHIVVEKATPGRFLNGAQEEARLEDASDRDGDCSRIAACRWPTASAPEGQGFKIAMAGLDGGRLNIGACSIGGAQFCLDAPSTT